MYEKTCKQCKKKWIASDTAELCPLCHDPVRQPYCSYKKQTIINLFRKNLESRGIVSGVFDDNTLLAIMETQFPEAYKLYWSNRTYTTISVPIGTPVYSFEIGAPHLRKFGKKQFTYRELKCLKCGRVRKVSSGLILAYLCGFLPRRCSVCIKRDTSGLKRGGRECEPGERRREGSQLFMARALNWSLDIFRRKKPTTFNQPLPIGTIVNNLEIIEAYWDEVVYTPKYRLRCNSCGNVFVILQSQVQRLYHNCGGTAK